MNAVRHQLDDRGMGENPSMGRHCNKGSFWKGITTEKDNFLGRFSCVDFMLYMNIFTIFPCQRLKPSKESTLKKIIEVVVSNISIFTLFGEMIQF